MDQVGVRLWIGDANDGRDWAQLEQRGITAVFNATQETDNWPADVKERIPYLRLDQSDGVEIPAERLGQFVEFMDRVYAAEQRIVLVHCGAGVSRASTFTIVALMVYHGMTWDEGEAMVRVKRPMISPNPVLKESVLRWWAVRHQRLKETAAERVK